jgi:hypothetical protein
MATAVFSATFDIKDLFNDPLVKKALRNAKRDTTRTCSGWMKVVY